MKTIIKSWLNPLKTHKDVLKKHHSKAVFIIIFSISYRGIKLSYRPRVPSRPH